jgi:hypothetical protein
VTEPQDPEERAFQRLYGRWVPLSPAEFAREIAGFDRPWWVVGGWAVEVATGFQRPHEDLDVSLLACDVPAFVEFVRGRWHVWNNVGGVLHPLGERWSTVEEPGSQLWLRADASSPWVVDMPLTPDVAGDWSHKHLPGQVAPVEEVTWIADDGIRYLRPEIVLSYKARLRRPKDEPDFEATLPLLDADRRAWLAEALRHLAPDHPWRSRLDAGPSPVSRR